MKKLIFAVAFATFGLANAQTDAFHGKGDIKAQVGANMQKWGTGIQASLDYGLGESFSIGAVAGYTLGYKELAQVEKQKPDADQRFDLRARLSAHLGDVMGLPQNVDLYPGLDVGLKNFGGHIGARYFFDKGFGLFAEFQAPFAKFKKNPSYYENLNNQPNFAIGASFDLTK